MSRLAGVAYIRRRQITNSRVDIGPLPFRPTRRSLVRVEVLANPCHRTAHLRFPSRPDLPCRTEKVKQTVPELTVRKTNPDLHDSPRRPSVALGIRYAYRPRSASTLIFPRPPLWESVPNPPALFWANCRAVHSVDITIFVGTCRHSGILHKRRCGVMDAPQSRVRACERGRQLLMLCVRRRRIEPDGMRIGVTVMIGGRSLS